jgi:hypothetical protein
VNSQLVELIESWQSIQFNIETSLIDLQPCPFNLQTPPLDSTTVPYPPVLTHQTDTHHSSHPLHRANDPHHARLPLRCNLDLPLLLTLYLVQKFYLRTSRQLRHLDPKPSRHCTRTYFSELLPGLVTVRAFGFQRALQKQHRAQLDRSQRPFYLLFAVQRWLTLVLDLVVAGIAVLPAALVVALCGKLGAGCVGVALLNVILFS